MVLKRCEKDLMKWISKAPRFSREKLEIIKITIKIIESNKCDEFANGRIFDIIRKNKTLLLYLASFSYLW